MNLDKQKLEKFVIDNVDLEGLESKLAGFMKKSTAVSKYIFLVGLFVTILSHENSSFAQSNWSSSPHNLKSSTSTWQTNLHNFQSGSNNLQNSEINRRINPKNWRNSADNWKYKTTKFTNKIGIFDSDGTRFEYRDPRKDKIVVKPYSNDGNITDRKIFGFSRN